LPLFPVCCDCKSLSFTFLLPHPEHQKQKGEAFSHWLGTLTGQLACLFLTSSEKILWFVTLLQADGLLHSVHPSGATVAQACGLWLWLWLF